MKVLVIVESSTKEKTIQKYLQEAFVNEKNTYTVKASGGHIADIVKKDFGLDKKTLQPIYAPLPNKKKTIDKLKQLVKDNDMTLLASDNDREGEAIAWHLKNILKPKKYKRIVFNEITKTAIYNAVTNPKDIDINMVNSQQARRVLDRLVGFNLTKMLWSNFSSQSVLSAGRVQSVVLLLIANKENDIKQFVTERYWNMLNTFDNGIVDAKLYKKSN
jgi:DNA topoisomerase-1